MKRSVTTAASSSQHPHGLNLPHPLANEAPSPPRSPTKPSPSFLHSLSTNPYVLYPLAFLLFVSFHLAISYLVTGTFHYGIFTPTTIPPRTFTPSELAEHDGVRSPTIYLAILGDVFDVTTGAKYYGPDGGYHAFAGKDGSRAFITGCFDTGAVADVRGLGDKEMAALVKWKGFYMEHKTYRHLGTVINPPVSADAPLPNDECK